MARGGGAEAGMKQYCRYCANALDYNGECEDFLCEADAPCGNNGCGRFYPASKAKRLNRCKHFVFNPNDIFSAAPDGSFRQYQPRGPYKPRAEQIKESGQIGMFDGPQGGGEGETE